MQLYNSATHRKEEFIPNHPDIVKMYTCGPTVYHFAHIGNLRFHIMEDVLEKYLVSGYNVKRVNEHYGRRHLSSMRYREDKMLRAQSASTKRSWRRKVLYGRVL